MFPLSRENIKAVLSFTASPRFYQLPLIYWLLQTISWFKLWEVREIYTKVQKCKNKERNKNSKKKDLNKQVRFMFDCTKLLHCQFQTLSSDIIELMEISVNKIK